MNGFAPPMLGPAPTTRPIAAPAGSPAATRTGAWRVDASALLDAAAAGLIVVDADGRLLYANASARRALDGGDAGLALAGGVVAPVDPHERGRWRAALRDADSGGTPSVLLEGADGIACVSLGPAPGPAGVACALPATRERLASTLRAFASAHALTGAEAAVLAGIVAGGSARSIAIHRGTSESTVRTQVRSILVKTGHASLRALAIDALRSAPTPVPGR